MGVFIYDELTGLPTLLATNRAKRPDQTGSVNTAKVVDKSKIFSKGFEDMTPPSVYTDADDWNVRVIPNKFPLVENHEIIIHSPDPTMDIEDLPHDHVVKIIRAYLARTSYYTSQDMEVFLFNNRGGKAGASITHPHSQLVALKGFPGIMENEKEEALHYLNEHNSCYWCDETKSALEMGSHVAFESSHFVAVVPKACRWSYEIQLSPKRHFPNIQFMTEPEINDFANILKSVLKAYNALFDRPDRNFWIHTQRYEPYHWHLGFIPHIKVFGGLELGAGIWVSDKATPEDAAKRMGEYIKIFYADACKECA